MYALDSLRNADSHTVKINKGTFNLPIQRNSNGDYKIQSGIELFVGLSTDFFIEEADAWRSKCWEMMKWRPDIAFRITTKRAERIKECLPDDWNDGYDNVMLQITVENQKRADERLSILSGIPAKHKSVFAAPLLEPIDLSPYLSDIELVMCGGENYNGSRVCRYDWVYSLYQQCKAANVTFNFIETGNTFINAEGEVERLTKTQQSKRALDLGLNYVGKPISYKLLNITLFDDKYEPKFSKCCENCSAKMTCNGCGKRITCSRNCK